MCFIKHLLLDLGITWPLMGITFFSSSSYQIYAENGLHFYVGFVAVMTIIGLFTVDKLVDDLIKKNAKPKSKLHIFYGIVSTSIELCLFAFNGWFLAATIWFISIPLTQAINQKLVEKYNEE